MPAKKKNQPLRMVQLLGTPALPPHGEMRCQGKALVLLACLLLEPEAQEREPLRQRFFLESNDSFEKALSDIRASRWEDTMTLKTLLRESDEPLKTGYRRIIQFQRENCWIDVLRFEECSQQALHAATPYAQALLRLEAASLYRGTFLAGVRLQDRGDESRDWTETKRQHYAELYQGILRELAGISLRANDFSLADSLYGKALAYDAEPLTPIELERLKAKIEAMQDDKPEPVVTSPPEAVPDDSLRLPSTRFIGRESECQEILQKLGEVRLLTLTGTGGGGKTRTALEVARHWRTATTDEVRLVELAALTDPALVPQAVATSLGVRGAAGQSLEETLRGHLAPKPFLLVLDNCEHLIVACASLAEALLAHCPRLRILATSREPLNIAWENAFPLNTLPFPSDPPDKAIAAYPAVQLFVERGQEAAPHFRLTEENEAAVAGICRRLDGIPLALELAARLLRRMGPEQIVAHLTERFDLLTGGNRTALPRQQTLEATIGWSYALLSQPERALWSHLSVLMGSWSEQDAVGVCTGTDLPPHAVIQHLGALVEKSLVTLEPRPQEYTYRFLETLREYGWQRLTSEEAEAAMRRHQHYFLEEAEKAEAHFGTPHQPQGMAQIERMYANLRVALDRGEPEKRLQLAGALWRFWLLRGYIQEGRHRLETLLHDGAQGNPAVRAKALHGAGTLALQQGDYAQARERLEESLAIRQAEEDTKGCAETLQNLGALAFSQQEFGQADAYLQQGLALQTLLENESGMANAGMWLGNIAFRQKNYVSAEAHYQACLKIYIRTGNHPHRASALLNLGMIALEQNRLSLARTYFQESLQASLKGGIPTNAAQALNNLGLVARAQGDYPTAKTYLEQSLALHRQHQNRPAMLRTLWNLGTTLVFLDQPQSARACLTESFTLARQAKDRAGIVIALDGFAWLFAAQCQPHTAIQLLSLAACLRRQLRFSVERIDHAIRKTTFHQCRSQSEKTTFLASWQAGRVLSLRKAIHLIGVRR